MLFVPRLPLKTIWIGNSVYCYVVTCIAACMYMLCNETGVPQTKAMLRNVHRTVTVFSSIFAEGKISSENGCQFKLENEKQKIEISQISKMIKSCLYASHIA